MAALHLEFQITVPAPLAAELDMDANPDVAVLVCVGGAERFAAPFSTLRRLSPFCNDLLPEDGSERTIPLDEPFATPDIVALLVAWLQHHTSTEPFMVPFPVPIVVDAKSLFTPWEGAFLGKVVCGPNFSTSGVPRLYRLGRLAGFLHLRALMRQCIALLAHFINVGVREHGDPTRMVRSWFGQSGDYTADEKKDVMEWMWSACDGMKLSKPEAPIKVFSTTESLL